MEKIVNFLTFLFGFMLPSGRTEIKLNKLIQADGFVSISRYIPHPITQQNSFHTETLQKHSSKWEKLQQFLEQHEKGWQKSPASFIGDIYIVQADVRLVYALGKHTLVLNFKDEKGKLQQYVKVIEAGELDFLSN